MGRRRKTGRTTGRVVLIQAMCVCSLAFSLSAGAQVLGERAEMGRLQVKAEEAMANDDPDGAAMAMGRAALMAAQLSKKETGEKASIYRAQEALFRSQEHTYRAMALFRRAGGELPASSGVCGSLALAHGTLRQAMELLPAPVSQPSPSASEEARVKDTADNWRGLIDAVIADYQCP